MSMFSYDSELVEPEKFLELLGSYHASTDPMKITIIYTFCSAVVSVVDIAW